MIHLPPSKSIGARYLVATFFAGTLPADPVFEDNDDLMLLQQALLEVYSDEEPIDFGDSPIDVGASGTALRFVTALCASTPGADYVITGTDRLMQRPLKPLMDVLAKAGATVISLGENNSGPYRVKGAKLKGGEFSIRGDISSQFISALMLVAPSWLNGITLNFSTSLVSRPYIDMTAKLMKKFRIELSLSDTAVTVKPGRYIEPADFHVETDWSSASFFYEAAALGAKGIILEDLPSPELSLQGDSIAAALFGRLGVVSHFNNSGAELMSGTPGSDFIEADFKDCPDLLLPFAVACLCTGTHFRFTNISNLRLKESDRIHSLETEVRKLGFIVTDTPETVEWNGSTCPKEEDPLIDPHDDHRVAMAFAMAALKFGKIRIENPAVVEKSFINFWNQLPEIGLDCSLDNNIMTVTK